MPITNVAQIKRITALCGAKIPEGCARARRARRRAEAVAELGVAYATLQCAELLARGAPGIHFYTLNRSPGDARDPQRAEAASPLGVAARRRCGARRLRLRSGRRGCRRRRTRSRRRPAASAWYIATSASTRTCAAVSPMPASNIRHAYAERRVARQPRRRQPLARGADELDDDVFGLGVVGARQQDRELGRSEPRHDVGLAQRAPEQRGGGGEQLVTRLITERVVDLLVVVDTEHDRRSVGPVACDLRDVTRELVLEAAPVEEPGQRVVVGHQGGIDPCRTVLSCGRARQRSAAGPARYSSTETISSPLRDGRHPVVLGPAHVDRIVLAVGPDAPAPSAQRQPLTLSLRSARGKTSSPSTTS